MAQGRWTILPGTDLYRKTVGLVGLGPIARAVIRRLQGFDADLLVSTPRPNLEYGEKHHLRYVDLDTLLKSSDFVSLHAAQTPGTTGMIDGRALGLMKQGAFLINTARASLVDEAALLDALRSGRLGGAALDLVSAETDASRRGLADELLRLPNVVMTPHAAASTGEALARTNMIAGRSVVDVLEGRSPPAACVVADGRPRRDP
jgi:D-3-phosphoglycerate dehydrogenase